MGLIAWYPLNGTGESKGLITNKFSIGASEYGDGGKIGKYYLTSNKIKGTGTISGIENFKQVSIAFWFKENKIETTAWQGFMKFYAYYDDGSKQAGGEFRLEQHTSSDKTQVYADWYCSTTSTSYPSYTGAAVYSNSPQITDLGWHHTVLMLDFVNHKCTSYFDGILNKTMNINTNAKYITGGLYIGDTNIDAGICDLRLYDNLLSIQEIKNLNNCLILHYPLGNGYGNENLIEEGNLASSWVEEGCTRENVIDSSKGNCLKVIGKNGNKRIYRAVENVWMTNNQKYQISFWAKTDTEKCQINFSRSMTDYTKDFTLTSSWNYYTGTITTTGISSSGTLSLTVKTTNGVIYIKDIKLQKGTAQMIYSPNPADALYKTLGYDATTEYDTSGFGNNGEKKNSPVYTTDSPIGNSCIQLQRANSQYIQLPEMTLPDTLTISFWAKVNSFGGWQRFFEFTDALQGANGNYRFLFGTFSNTKQLGLHIYGGSDGTTSWFVNSNIGEIDTNWHSYSISINKTILNIFYDGKNILNKTITDNFPIHKRQYMYIGKSSYSADAYFDGEISDFRIYATALTADDIKQLYQTKAKIDKNGNLYCNQFIDNDYEEELLTTQKMTFHQATSQGTITYETNGNEVINIITMDNTISSWKYLFNNAFDKTKIINHKLKLSFKYKTNVSTAYSMAVKMCKGDSTKPQTINIGSITLSTNWQEYNGIITFGNTYDNQGIYIHTGNFCGGNLYIKDLSLKIYENNNKTDFTKKSQIITGELSELDSNKTYVYKNSKIVTNQIIEN